MTLVTFKYICEFPHASGNVLSIAIRYVRGTIERAVYVCSVSALLTVGHLECKKISSVKERKKFSLKTSPTYTQKLHIFRVRNTFGKE